LCTHKIILGGWISGRSLNRARHAAGPVCQQQFWERFTRHAKGFREGLEYMHLNLVRRAFVQRPGDWPWSSYPNFALDKKQIKCCRMQIDYVHLPESVSRVGIEFASRTWDNWRVLWQHWIGHNARQWKAFPAR